MNPFHIIGVNSVPSKYVLSLPSRSSTLSSPQEKRYILAAHISWIRELVNLNGIPGGFPVHETLPEEELQAHLSQGKIGPFGPEWMFLLLTVIKSSSSTTHTFKSLESLCKPATQTSGGRMTWPQIVDFIGEANFNHVWEQPQITLLDSKNDSNYATGLTTDLNGKSLSSSYVTLEESTYLSKLLKHIYVNLEDSSPKDGVGGVPESNSESTRFPVSNLSKPLTIITILPQNNLVATSTTDSSSAYFFIFHPYIPHSVHDAVTFSPHKLASTAKQMFVAYQILQFLRDFQQLGIPVGNLSLSDFRIDDCLYINVVPSITNFFEQLKVNEEPTKPIQVDPRVLVAIKSISQKVRGWDEFGQSSNLSDINLNPKLLELIIRHWCEGLISNYDYILFLNYLSGRFCNGNPNYHPVFPWVADFSSAHGGWRDLTKSKFRLNKGESQLDITYEDIGSSGNHEKRVPHHVTDILSEITFYVYKARRTAREVLCKFVRPTWVPGEYPISIVRMQEWTPDECIPEFFDDPTIFKSIHDDLPDLQVPKWCSSAEDFIHHHRKLLESDMTSAKLHHWIDLTFGYKLSGSAAVKSKNIYLTLVDCHQDLESHGIVQLFQTPHPPRNSHLRNQRNVVSYYDLKKLRETDEEDRQEPNEQKNKAWRNIHLPRHYDATGFLNDFEVCFNFFKSHFPYLKDPQVTLTQAKNRSEICHIVKLFGCLLVEIVLPIKVRHGSTIFNIEEKFNFYKDIVKGSMNLVPLFCRRAVQAIFDRDSLEFSIPMGISLDLLLLGDRLGPIPFPIYFDEVYKMLRTMRNYEKILATAAPDDVVLKLRVQELKVKSFSRDLIQLLGSLDTDGIDLVAPFVIEMFNNPETRVLAVWNLFCPFARAIGRKKSIERLLYPIVQIYESDYHSEKHLKLFHRTFLLQLSSCFGLKIFLEHFCTLLIEAIGGWKQSDCIAPGGRTHLTSTDLEIERLQDSSYPVKRASASNLKRAESETAESVTSNQSVEPEMFLMEPDVSDSEDKDSGTQTFVGSGQLTTSTTSETSNSAGFAFPSVFITEAKNSSQSGENSRTESPLQSSRYSVSKDGTNTRSSSVSSGTGSKSIADISDLCCESVVWLAHRLGPMLTAKYLTKNLLKMLTLCYLGHLDLLVSPSAGLLCEGDVHSKKVLECLIAISDLYGDSFIERQYLPYGKSILMSAKDTRKLSAAVEGSLIGVSTLLEKVVTHMPDTLLMAQLKDPVMNDILAPLIKLVCSANTDFPSESVSRALLASKCIAMMNAIRKKIGPDLSQLHLKPCILTFCETLNSVYNGSIAGHILAEMAYAFDSSIASQIFTNFCEIITGTEQEDLIRDLYLQQGINERSVLSKNGSSPMSEKSAQKVHIEQQSSFGSRSFGNRIQVQETESTAEEIEVSIPARKDTTRHLRGNWLVYWEHETGRPDSKFNFKQIKLHTFTGHTAAVRWIHALDNENSFLTASKDRTVKLFSLRNQGDETVTSSCQWTYSNHKKAVLSVLFHEPMHIAASTDGVVHIWDPFVGKVIRVLEKPTNKASPVCSIKPILNSNHFIGAGIDSTVHVIDIRTCGSYELKIGIGQASGLVRCVAVSDSGQIVSVGHSSGMLSTLDLRNGTLLGSWKAHEGEVLQLLPYRNKQLISSSFDQNISVWNLDDNRHLFNMRGPTEPVHSIAAYESELITCTTSNRIGIHCGIEGNSDFSSTRLRSDAFKGIVTSMRLLPLNQFLLLGSDSGNVVLLC